MSTFDQHPAQMLFGKIEDMLARVTHGMERSRDYLFSQQHEDGYWCGELEADTTLESDYIIIHTLLGTGNRSRMERAVPEIISHQNEDGGWPIYAGGPSNISASVKAYFALKIMGYKADHPVLERARETILQLGGATECNTFTKIYLCFLGQYDWEAVPFVPPEIVIFPNWFWFNIYEISSWSRAILVPLSIAYAKKPLKKLPTEMCIDELFIGGRHGKHLHLKWNKKLLSCRNFFLVLNRGGHFCERFNIRPLRYLALRRAERWMLGRFEKSDGLGAIFPGILNSIIALRCLGYSTDDPQVIRALDEFEKLGIEEPGIPDHSEPTFRMAPCYSPVWDTAYAMFALGESGVSKNDPRMIKAADWILSKEVRCLGDWAVKVRNVLPGGWYFEFNNEFYPDVDDSAMVLLGLDKVDNPRERYQHEVSRRAIDWILAMQCKNGGWASFDKDNPRMVVQKRPFADHNDILGPPPLDITQLLLEMLHASGFNKHDPPVKKAIKFLLKEQEADGSWFRRCGVNYMYRTMLDLHGLQAMRVRLHEPYVHP